MAGRRNPPPVGLLPGIGASNAGLMASPLHSRTTSSCIAPKFLRGHNGIAFAAPHDRTKLLIAQTASHHRRRLASPAPDQTSVSITGRRTLWATHGRRANGIHPGPAGILLAAFALAAIFPATAFAQAPWSDSFDTYAAGSQMHGQGGWKGWDNNPAWRALVCDAYARSSPNSVEIVGASDLVHEYSGLEDAP